MWDFLVLGRVPGTDFQISFGIWLLAAAAVFTAATILRRAARQRRSSLANIAADQA